MASSVNRISGRYAICQMGHTSAVLLLTEWQVQIRTEFVDGTGFGDFWDVPVPIKYLWTARAEGRFAGSPSYLQAYHLVQSGTTDIIEATFVGYADDTASMKLFQGSGFAERASFMAPEGMVQQQIEIRGRTAPGIIT